MLNLYFEQLWLTTIFLSIFSFEEYRALTICPNMTWSSNGTTIAGSSLGLSNNTAAYLKKPQDAFVDQNGTLYVLDSGNLRVQVFFPNSTIGTTIINGTSGSKLNQFYTMDGISVDLSGNIYILDHGNERATKWVPGAVNGTVVAGNNGMGNRSNQLNLPYGFFVDPITLFIWIADTYNSRIVRWESPSTGIIVCGSNGTRSDQFYSPFGLFVDTINSNTIYVADTFNHRVQMWLQGATNGTTIAGQTSVCGSGLNQLCNPESVIVDTNGYIYIADNTFCRIMRWKIGSTSGTMIAGDSIFGSLPNQLYYPYNIKFDPNGALIIADTYNNRVQKFVASCGTIF
ncbi:unnamed protein product [Adineta steineri]|uniref:NHL repeat containing protein-like protein n=1 Tax=Adineta steineri TaxID=433720 RepID=A0A814PFN7_9BILA|nr:unnamed protein product [Adineta steineri]CAF1103155.1 unnamed protein product [Adineta steineri]